MSFGFELTPEQRQLKETAHRFAVEEIIPKAAQYDEDHTFPADITRKAWAVGLMNPQIPYEYGGLGLAKVLFTRGDEIHLPEGTKVEMVLEKPLTLAPR